MRCRSNGTDRADRRAPWVAPGALPTDRAEHAQALTRGNALVASALAAAHGAVTSNALPPLSLT